MSRFPLLLNICLGLLCVTQPAQAQDSLDDFAARVPLKVEGNGPWYRVDLPMSLHFVARHADLRDLRIFNAEGEPLAYALTRSESEVTRNEEDVALKWFPLRGPADAGQGAPRVRVQRSTTGTVVEVLPEDPAATGERLRGWLLDASAVKTPLEKLVIDWSEAGEGFQRFSIEASDDLQGWRSWGTGQIARLSFGDDHIYQREVVLPGQKARYLRLLWLDREAPLLTEARVTGARQESRPAPLVWSEPLVASTTGKGEYAWDLPLPLPIERLKFSLDQANTLAPVQLQARRNDTAQWQGLTSGLLYRLPQDGSEAVQDQLVLSGWTPVQHLKMSVDPRAGGFGAKAPTLQVGMRALQVVFLARGTPPYTLAIGQPGAATAELPLTTLVPGYGPGSLEKMGRAQLDGDLRLAEQKAVVVAAEKDSALAWKRIGLWAVLLLGVGLLVLMALSLLKGQGKGA
ncbi:hypothetical protein PHLH8_55730 [Pseudomonas sp. Pc102]|uniref:DUF3999 domain-containing protein n=1 Tax=Pseudomonas sp. Pc102 TaxID=2678261 RepID=UPI001BCD10A5|nr:DUF3999 domain-containing protein [Pseudomonas sp. Pc102]BBP85931.1 hypothetical protein PHLH8_55730 [Pseudomonas sp. Pc102]